MFWWDKDQLTIIKQKPKEQNLVALKHQKQTQNHRHNTTTKSQRRKAKSSRKNQQAK
jgi:hypothetical protein